MRCSMYNPNLIKTAYDDERFDKTRHFIRSDVTAQYLKHHEVNISVEKFKQTLKEVNHSFIAEYGNANYHPYAHVKVWNINLVKKYLEALNEQAQTSN